MNIVLINPYELGRQPFGLAQPAAWLTNAGFTVQCIDLALEKLNPEVLREAGMVAVHLPMHTATRIALEALPRLREMAPNAHLCAYGLYAPPNAPLLRERGFQTILGGECEPGLLETAQHLRSGHPVTQPDPATHLGKVAFVPPLRDALPALDQYADLIEPDASRRRVGFTEASRGCKHLCRHCPVVPVYGGRFRIVPVEVVLADIRQQVAAGAQHISFGDPDFLNGPTHARRVLEAFRNEFPEVTYDCTIKVEHLLADPGILHYLSETGCRFVTTAVEAVDDEILEYLDKGHDTADFERLVALAGQAGLALAPTFVPFTPWTTLTGYKALLDKLIELELVEAVPGIQLAIRLLIPAGSRLLELDSIRTLVGDFDPALLGYPWQHSDPAVDRLQTVVESLAAEAEQQEWSRRDTFGRIYEATCNALGVASAPLPERIGQPIAHHSEPWYCCAEPTSAQLQSF